MSLGCTASHMTYGSYHGYYVENPPPASYDEETPPPPSTGYTWVPGYWYWSGYDYVWVQGRYAQPPVPGYIYVRSGWVSNGGGYRFVRGYWAPGGYVSAHSYIHVYRSPVRGTRYRYYRR